MTTPSRPSSVVPLVLALALTALAARAQAAPDPRWWFASDSWIILPGSVEEAWVPEPPSVVGDHAYFDVDVARLPAALQAAAPSKLRVRILARDGSVVCRGVVDRLVVVAERYPTPDDGTYRLPDDPVEPGDDGWATSLDHSAARFVLIAVVATRRPKRDLPRCAGGFIATRDEDDAGPLVLAPAVADAALTAQALVAFRAHGFYRSQQATYEHTVANAGDDEITTVLDSRGRWDAEARAALRRPRVALLGTILPARWDTPFPGATPTDTPHRVAVFAHPVRAERVVVVSGGNGVDCHAPPGWVAFVVDAAGTFTPLAYGASMQPDAVLDVDRDGRYELHASTGPIGLQRVFRDALDGAPAVAIEAGEDAEADALYCGQSQFQP